MKRQDDMRQYGIARCRVACATARVPPWKIASPADLASFGQSCLVIILVKTLRSLFGNKARQAASPQIPLGQRVYAVGDVHGRHDLREQILAQITADDAARSPAKSTIIFLGDLIDRGPSSAAVLEHLIGFARQRCVRFIRGNHEEVLLELLERLSPELARTFTRIGGRETALSYGISQAEYEACDFAGFIDLLAARLPPSHREFLRATEDMILIGDYLFVHAGIDPSLPLRAQDPRRTRWIRDGFTDARGPFEKFVVHGHSISPHVEEHASRIGLDTGAYRSGRLSAMGFEGKVRWLIQAVREPNAQSDPESGPRARV